MTVEPKPNQGMRQPQLGGLRGDLSKQGIATAAICRHGRDWRVGDKPWRCETCHPPAIEYEGIERRTSLPAGAA